MQSEEYAELIRLHPHRLFSQVLDAAQYWVYLHAGSP